MEIISFGASLRRRRGYNRMSPTNRRAMPVARLGAGKRSWRLKLARKLRQVRVATPLKLWYKLKNSYMRMMLRLATNSGSSNSTNVFGSRRIPKARDHVSMEYSRTEFDNRLLFEIYKSMSSSLELGYTKQS